MVPAPARRVALFAAGVAVGSRSRHGPRPLVTVGDMTPILPHTATPPRGRVMSPDQPFGFGGAGGRRTGFDPSKMDMSQLGDALQQLGRMLSQGGAARR